jgi:hypothetical protein
VALSAFVGFETDIAAKEFFTVRKCRGKQETGERKERKRERKERKGRKERKEGEGKVDHRLKISFFNL